MEQTNVSSCKIKQHKALNWENKLISSRNSKTEIAQAWQPEIGLLFLSVFCSPLLSAPL